MVEENHTEPKYRDEKWLRNEIRDNCRTAADVAEELGYNKSTVLKWKDRFDIKKKHRDPEWLQKQVDIGKTLSAIREEAGVGKNQTITRSLDKFDIRMPEEEFCEQCGNYFTKLTTHWARSDCSFPEISDRKWQMLKGLLMGDGSIHMGSTNPCFQWNSINKPFMEWFAGEMGELSSSLKFSHDAEQSARNARKSGFRPDAKGVDYHDIYSWYSIRHPAFEEFEDWYYPNGKEYPVDLELTSEAARIWYCGDGYINYGQNSVNGYSCFKCSNESHREEFLIRLFEQHGFSPNINGDDIQFSVKETKELLQWMGEAPPGFEYKWEHNNYKQYQLRKEEAYNF